MSVLGKAGAWALGIFGAGVITYVATDFLLLRDSLRDFETDRDQFIQTFNGRLDRMDQRLNLLIGLVNANQDCPPPPDK